LLAALLLLVVNPALPGGSAPEAQLAAPPNVVVIMTDDQDRASLRHMPKVDALLQDEGTTFSRAFATTPLCCPSRASFLTGQYAHNHDVRTNFPPHGGYPRLDQSETLPVWLERAGYRTAHVGKFLNLYGIADPYEVPLGWSEWYGAIDPSAHRMYGYTLNENGTLVDYGTEPSDYQTDVYADKAVDFVQRSAPGEPFFLSVAPLAPHMELNDTGPRPAPRHQGAFADAALPRPASFNEKDVSDKPAAVRDKPRLTTGRIEELTALHRNRLASLLAVDDLVGRLVAALGEAGELENTLVMFTSDNGYLLGQHRLTGKAWQYEESVGVPLIARGPGFPAGAIRNQVVGNIDLAPTILQASGARPGAGHALDGRSLLGPANDPTAGSDRELVLESQTAKGTFAALQTRRYLWVRHATGERELYDRRQDPLQLTSRHAREGYRAVRRTLARRLNELDNCSGASCR